MYKINFLIISIQIILNILNNHETIVLKIVGKANSGKSSIFIRFTEGIFSTEPIPTIGSDFKTKKISINGRKINYQIWDLHGGEFFRKLVKSYYHGSDAFLIVFDITSRESFDDVKFWICSIRETDFPQPVLIVLAGNKSYLYTERKVTKDEAESFATENGINYFETSAKNNEGLDDVFTYIATITCNNGAKIKHKSVTVDEEESKKSGCL